MTVIAALVETEDSLLIAADSGETQMPGELLAVVDGKLRKHSRAPLAWAATGDAQVGLEFSRWLESHPGRWDHWDAFLATASEQLARVNGRRRELAKLAGVELGDNDVASVLLAGWVGGKPEIVELDDRGGIALLIEDHFRSTGSGGPHASIAYTTLKVCHVVFPTELMRMQVVMNVAATMAKMCSPPVHVWRVTRSGVSDAQAPSAKASNEDAGSNSGSNASTATRP